TASPQELHEERFADVAGAVAAKSRGASEQAPPVSFGDLGFRVAARADQGLKELQQDCRLAWSLRRAPTRLPHGFENFPSRRRSFFGQEFRMRSDSGPTATNGIQYRPRAISHVTLGAFSAHEAPPSMPRTRTRPPSRGTPSQR